MSQDPEGALQAAVLARLKADPAVDALVRGRVWAEAPDRPVHPYVALGRSRSRPLDGAEGAEEHALSVTCASRFGGSQEAKAVVAAARAALHDAALEVVGRRLVSLRAGFADVFGAADRRTTLGVLRLRAVTDGEG